MGSCKGSDTKTRTSYGSEDWAGANVGDQAITDPAVQPDTLVDVFE